jgi:hypothetical protein
MDILNGFFNWLPWLLGGGIISTVALLVVIFFFAPSLMPAVGSFLKPIAGFLGEAIVSFGKILSHGIGDIIDDGKTIVTVTFMTGLIYGWFYYSYPKGQVITEANYSTCKPVVDDLRKKFKFIKRK